MVERAAPLAPHLVVDLAGDLSVAQFEAVNQANVHRGANRKRHAGHLVADDVNLSDQVVEHEVAGREPARVRNFPEDQRAEDPRVSVLDLLGAGVDHSTVRGFPAGVRGVKRDGLVHVVRVLVVEVRRDDVKVPLLDLFLGQRRICGERRLLAIAGGPFQGPRPDATRDDSMTPDPDRTNSTVADLHPWQQPASDRPRRPVNCSAFGSAAAILRPAASSGP